MIPLCGIPMLGFLLRRLKKGLPLDKFLIVLATTENKEDEVVATWGYEEGVEVIRGEENDVLKRYIKCLTLYPTDIIVRVTADNPLTCPKMINKLVDVMEMRSLDYVECRNLPYGSGVDVFSAQLLKLLDIEAKDASEREHINLFVLRNQKRFNIHLFNVSGEIARPDLRMTVDTKEDWENIKSIFIQNEAEPWMISLEEAVTRMDRSSRK